MYCYSIKNGKIVKGLPDTVPHDPAIKVTEDGMILKAQFLLESVAGNRDSLLEIQKLDLTAASSLALFELAPHEQNKKQTHILVGFDPVECRLAKEYGDESDLVYRTAGLFVARCPKKAFYICPKDPEAMHAFEIKKNVPVRLELEAGDVIDRERRRIDKRRESDTVVFKY